jgi:adenosylcobinamide kinase / adenosylcobinamide-phosphate guanylyltransferase
MAQSALYFITGGVRSGKSRFAERTAREWVEAYGGNLHYLACSRVFDEEMAKRVDRHRQDREDSLIPWKTWEYSTDIDRIITGINEDSVVLLDCLTTLVDNELFTHETFTPEKPFHRAFLQAIFTKIMGAIEAIRKQAACLIIVSNEVIQDLIFHNEFLKAYGGMLGTLHQAIVECADVAYLVEWGVPVVKKVF